MKCARNPVTYSSCGSSATMICSSCSDPTPVNYTETDTKGTPSCGTVSCLDPVVGNPMNESVSSYTEVSCPNEGCSDDDM
jgi:hypothetical protein